MSARPLALTMGEPAGIGPDITLLAWAELRHESGLPFIALADPEALAERAARLGLGMPLAVVSEPAEAAARFPQALPVLPVELPCRPAPGSIESATAAAVIRAIDRAVDLTLAGEASAVVTNPIQKETLYAAGFAHEGHTDYLAALAHARGHAAEPVMMLANAFVRVVPVTVHIPLKDVPGRLTREAIVTQGRIVARHLRDCGFAEPRLAVTGLNPHAGEGGRMGREEIDVIAPAIAQLRAEGLSVQGPLPADTAFHEEARAGYDAILCMYHDQALIPVKALDFHGGVNCTLGLPFIRTSPDHGTALALAGTGKARPDSLIAALRLAARLAASRR
jgi:4-hydroxythreonine-4-phosphate dehydrogenase